MSGTSHEGDVLSQLTVPLLAYDQWWNDRHASLQRRGWKAPNDSSCTIHVAACTLLTSSTASWLACIYMWRAVSLRASIIFTCMRIYVTHVRLWFTPFYCTSTSVGHEKFIMHGCFLSHACIHSRFLQGLLPPHAINLLHSCDTVRPGPMQCRNHAALAAFCFLYACWHGAVRMDVVCLSHFPVVCVKESFPCACMMHTCRSTRYSTAGSYFFLFFCYTSAGLSCTRTASLPGCAKRNGRKRAKL